MKPRIAIYTRMSYAKPIPDDRLRIFNDVFLASMKAQFSKDFDLFLMVDTEKNAYDMKPAHPDNEAKIRACDTGDLRVRYCKYPNVPRTGYHASFRLDTDEWCAPTFILKVRDAFLRTRAEKFLMTFYHFAYDTRTGKFYSHPFGRHCKSWGKMPSAILGTCTKYKNQDTGFWPYALGRHWQSAKATGLPVTEIHDELVVSTIHGNNLGSEVSGRWLADGRMP